MSTCQVEINDDLISRNKADLNKQINDALALIEYIQCNISIGKLAELTGRGVVESKEWINDLGVLQNYNVTEVEERQKVAVDALIKDIKDKK